jgi:hypothetical protein
MTDKDPFAIYPYRWPIVNSGNSWSVPRISMPGFYSIQWDFQIDSWYYVGHLVDAAGNEYSFNLIVGRNSLSGRNRSPQMAYLGVGLGSTALGTYLSCLGYGIDVSDDPLRPAALTVPPAGDFAYDVLFKSSFTDTKARIRYTGGSPVGIAGATYRIDLYGTSADQTKQPIRLTVELIDRRGTLLEGSSGCVAPLEETASGVFTYEIAQPQLEVTGGSLRLASGEVKLTGGNLWHDRQAYTYSPHAAPPPAPTGASLEEMLKAAPSKGGNLYRGAWIGLKFDNGNSMLVTPQWGEVDTPGQQWVSGRAVHRPPVGGYGNLFLPLESPYHYNGGALLLGGSPGKEDWDFDLNIFNPDDPEASPHWQSPVSGNVYATKWSLKFSPALAQWDVPGEVFLEALVQDCENSLLGSNPFWEGAVRIFADRECTRLIGHGFAEQMGYN